MTLYFPSNVKSIGIDIIIPKSKFIRKQFFPMRKDSQEILPDAFEDPQLDCLAYLTFVGVDDKDINFSFIVDANDD